MGNVGLSFVASQLNKTVAVWILTPNKHPKWDATLLPPWESRGFDIEAHKSRDETKPSPCVWCSRFHYSEFEQQNPEPKPRGGLGMKQRGPDGKEEESQAWLSMLEKATNSVRYISRHIKKEHFIREVCSSECVCVCVCCLEEVKVWDDVQQMFPLHVVIEEELGERTHFTMEWSRVDAVWRFCIVCFMSLSLSLIFYGAVSQFVFCSLSLFLYLSLSVSLPLSLYLSLSLSLFLSLPHSSHCLSLSLCLCLCLSLTFTLSLSVSLSLSWHLPSHSLPIKSEKFIYSAWLHNRIAKVELAARNY